MPRVLEILLQGRTPDENAEFYKSIAREAVVLDATNVAQWYEEHVNAMPEQDRLDVFERCIPPFAVTCVEFPQEAVSHDGTLTHVGVLVWRTEGPEGWTLWAITVRTDLARHAGLYPVLLKLPVSTDGTPDWDHFGVVNTRDLQSFLLPFTSIPEIESELISWPQRSGAPSR